MQLYLIQSMVDEIDPGGKCGCFTESFIIAHEDEASARAMAQEYGSDETDYMSWENSDDASCKLLAKESEFTEPNLVHCMWTMS